jgi:hypothetical protein
VVKIMVGVDLSPGAQRALAAPLYFPSQEGLAGPAVAAARVAGLDVRS